MRKVLAASMRSTRTVRCTALRCAPTLLYRRVWVLLAAQGCSSLLLAAPGCSGLLLAAPGCCSWLLLAAHCSSGLLPAAPHCSLRADNARGQCAQAMRADNARRQCDHNAPTMRSHNAGVTRQGPQTAARMRREQWRRRFPHPSGTSPQPLRNLPKLKRWSPLP